MHLIKSVVSANMTVSFVFVLPFGKVYFCQPLSETLTTSALRASEHGWGGGGFTFILAIVVI